MYKKHLAQFVFAKQCFNLFLGRNVTNLSDSQLESLGYPLYLMSFNMFRFFSLFLHIIPSSFFLSFNATFLSVSLCLSLSLSSLFLVFVLLQLPPVEIICDVDLT